MRIIGHRGTPSCPGHSENTLQSIRTALDGGADGVEVDVQATREGVLVLAHDPDLGRVLGTGARTGPVVAETTLGELRALRLPEGARIPTLAEALDLVAARRGFVVTEVKPEAGGAVAARTARLLAALLDQRREQRPGADRVTTSSFDLLTRMPAGSYLVNTARGGLVDLDAVLDALQDGRLAGVALDVLPQEPPPRGHPLLTHPRALLTPHVAWFSEEAEAELRRKAAQNVVDWARTGRPTYPVVDGR